MKTIFKYPIGYDGNIQMPIGAEILCTGIQNDCICIWALVDPTAELEQRNFITVGTGWKIDVEPAEYIGTIQQDGFVWHIFGVK